MFQSANFLLINGTRERRWLQLLQEALSPLGKLQAEEERKAIERLSAQEYDIVILDATLIDDVPLLISRIRAQRPDARVVVATASPTWTRAREAFYAGATDYVRKSLNKEEILSVIREVLTKTPPPWPGKG
jgi:DNA-binding NtrC family response regulator